MKILLIINPVAGRQIMVQEEDRVRQILEQAAQDVICVHTKEDVHIKTQIEDAVAAGDTELIVCAGGDGTLNQVVCGLLTLELNLPLGYLPVGTTNDFATSLKLPKKPMDAVHRVLEGEEHRLDAGKFGSDKYFVYVASFGAFTQTSYTTTQSLKNTLGHMAYILEGMKELPNLKAYHIKVETEDESFEEEFVFGSVSNTSSIGGVIRLSEDDVSLNDGMLELTLVKMPKNLIDFHRIVVGLINGSYDPTVITFRHVKTVKFSAEEEIPWSLDGEYASGGTDVDIVALPGAFSLRY